MDRNEIIEQLSSYQRVDTQKQTIDLEKKLYKHLVDKHPIHKRLQMLSSKQVKRLHSELNLKVTARLTKTYQKNIAHYFFIKFEESPLTNLERVITEKGINVVAEKPVQQQKQGKKQKQNVTVLSFGLTSDQSVSANRKKSKTTNADATSQGSIEKSAGKTQQNKRTRSISDQRDGSNATKKSKTTKK